jgi:hypothetical protein
LSVHEEGVLQKRLSVHEEGVLQRRLSVHEEGVLQKRLSVHEEGVLNSTVSGLNLLRVNSKSNHWKAKQISIEDIYIIVILIIQNYDLFSN